MVGGGIPSRSTDETWSLSMAPDYKLIMLGLSFVLCFQFHIGLHLVIKLGTKQLQTCYRQKTVNSPFSRRQLKLHDSDSLHLSSFSLESILSDTEVILLILSSKSSSDLCVTSTLNYHHQSNSESLTGKSPVTFVSEED